jgi:hypothetical protein
MGATGIFHSSCTMALGLLALRVKILKENLTEVMTEQTFQSIFK